MRIFYSELASFWPLLSPAEDYEEEALEVLHLLEARRPDARTLLELGSGGGHVAAYLKRRFALTLTDLSPEMLAVSERVNPECEHLAGDMRALDLGRRFDLVLAHDAIDYMASEADLEAAFRTAHRHLVPGGLALFAPDHVRERYEPGTECGGTTAPDGRALRYLEWSTELGDDESTVVTHYAFLVREADGAVRSLHETHLSGVFPSATWRELLERVGFEVEIVEERTEDDRAPRLFFIGRK